jgi:hypothetical protein
MSRVASLLRRRVPIYVWLPIILACAVAGSIASTLRPVPPIPSPPHVPRSEKSSQIPLMASPAKQRLFLPTSGAHEAFQLALGPGECFLHRLALQMAHDHLGMDPLAIDLHGDFRWRR